MATYYMSTPANGGSDLNNGSIGSPVATLGRAAAIAIAVGDIIHVNAGTYTITSPVNIRVGVSIEGAGDTSLFNCNYSASWYNGHSIILSSSSEGTDGNQHIRNIKMSGGSGVNSEIATAPILVEKRKNVEIDHCTIVNFFEHGVMFIGSTITSDSVPTVYPTGNSFHDNIVTNCATFVGMGGGSGAGKGCLAIGGQRDMLIYNNTLTVSYRSGGINGYCVKYAEGGNIIGCKFYNNTFIRPPYSGINNDFDFALEFWNIRGGVEIYNNTTNGSIDFGGQTMTDAAGYGFSAKVHNNTIGWSSMQGAEQLGIDIEGTQTGGLYIYNNHFKNLSKPINFYQGFAAGGHDICNDIYIYYNIFEGVSSGYYGVQFGNGSGISAYNNTSTFDNINFLNNVFYAGAGNTPSGGLHINPAGASNNIRVRNNIIYGFTGESPITITVRSGITMSNLYIQNNDFYGNAHSNTVYYYSGTPSPQTVTDNKTTNPLFVSAPTDFSLQSLSPAIDAGIALGLSFITSDYAGNSIPVNSIPDIGVYEYGYASAVIPTILTSSVNSITTTSAVSGGNVTSDGGSMVTARGVCWATTSNPTTANSKTTNGTGTGTFTSSITGLTQGTIYHVRAYATNNVGTSYGSDIQFITTTPVVLPTVTTLAVTGITYTLGYGNGIITSNGGATVTGGFCWATHSSPTLSDSSVSVGTGTGQYSGGLQFLTHSTLYYVRAWATNSAGTAYGNEVTFTTLVPTIPTVSTGSVVGATQTTLSVTGSISSDGGDFILQKGMCYSVYPNTSPTISDLHTQDGSYTTSWTSIISGLTGFTNYYVRAYATNSIGTGYGTVLLLQTADIPPTVSTVSISNITSTTASSGSNITSLGGGTIFARGVCWSTSTGPTILDSLTSDATSVNPDTVSATLSGLTPSTLYYVRAYATNNEGTSYGEELIFTTLAGSSWITIARNKIHRWFCYDPNVIPSGLGYGSLYNWYAVDSGLLAPTGWHVITYDEWSYLVSQITNDSDGFGNSPTAGPHLIETGTTHWDVGNGDNTSGISLVGNGQRSAVGTFSSFRGNCGLWGIGPNHNCYLWTGTASVQLIPFYNDSLDKMGFAVRCVKDLTSLSNGQTSTVTDIDGNVYQTLCIGTKEITISNLKTTKYNNGNTIPEIADNTAWGVLTTGAMCYYNNDINNA